MDGGKIAVQLASFLNGWRSFQTLCDAERLLPPHDKLGEKGDGRGWVGQHIPRLTLLEFPVILPKWTQVRAYIREGIASLGIGLGAELPVMSTWRHWKPGIVDSQMDVLSHSLGRTPLVAAGAPDKRLHSKTFVPRWRKQQLAF